MKIKLLFIIRRCLLCEVIIHANNFSYCFLLLFSSIQAGYDSFCWKCHDNKVNLCCYKCIRSFHAACVKISKFDNIWLCPECTTVDNLLNNPKRYFQINLQYDRFLIFERFISISLKEFAEMNCPWSC